MLSVSAWYILKKRHLELAKSNLKVALPAFILFAIDEHPRSSARTWRSR